MFPSRPSKILLVGMLIISLVTSVFLPVLKLKLSYAQAASTILDRRIKSGADDVEQLLSTGYMFMNSSDLELVTDPDETQGLQSVGLRFTGISIPKGTAITRAYIEFQVDETSSEATSLVLRGEAVDNAAAFSSNVSNVTNRRRTIASVNWSNPGAWNTIGAKVQTPDLSIVIQEIINRAGWVSGNNLVLFVDGTGRRVGEAYEGVSSAAPLLHVEYSTGTNPLPTSTSVPSSPITPTATSSQNSKPQPAGQNGNWKLVFNDEFNGSSLDLTKWHTCFWWADVTCTIESNHELELYNPEDVSVQNGLLRLRAQKRDMTAWNGATYNYTSGMVMTGGRKGSIQPGFTFKYGFVEASVKVPAGKGLWPAFWLLPASYVSRPEIDIMEILGHEVNVYHMNFHYLGGDSGATWAGPDFSAGWHVLGLDWEPGAIIWYVDGVERWRYRDQGNISNVSSYLLLNLAVGGDWPGAPDANTPFPSFFEIEYVRVWQK